MVLTAATDMFVGALAREAAEVSHKSNRKTVTGADVKGSIDSVGALDFLKLDL